MFDIQPPKKNKKLMIEIELTRTLKKKLEEVEKAKEIGRAHV